MKHLAQKIFSPLLAFLVLFSTLSFTVDKHYCGNSLVDVAVFSSTKGCGMENTVNTDCPDTSLQKKCCDDEEISFQGQKEITVTIDDLTIDQQLFLVSYVYSYINLFEGLKENIIPFKNYSSPLVVKDIQLLDQTFLI